MGIHPINKPHFFKPLIQDFLTKFSIPKSFGKHLDDDDHKTYAMLKDRREKASWKVKIHEEIENDRVQYYFKDGWQEFCIAHGFKFGDFLVFQHLGSFVFDVSVFEPSACERELPSSLLMGASSSTHPLHGKQGLIKTKGHKTRSTVRTTTFTPRGYPYYQTTAKSYWPRSGVVLSKKFGRETGLEKEGCKRIVMVDPKGEPWKMGLRHKSNQDYIIGWGPFHLANSLKRGLNVVFELLDIRANNAIINFYVLG